MTSENRNAPARPAVFILPSLLTHASHQILMADYRQRTRRARKPKR